MTPTAPPRLLTADEFARLPDDGTRQELVRGVLVSAPLGGFFHGAVCARVGARVGAFVDDHGVGFVTGYCGVILARAPDTVRGPDVAYWSRERLPDPPREGYPSVAPDLVVEVVSPSDVFIRVQQKVQEYLTAGVRAVWVLVPDDRSVAVFRPDRPVALLANGDTLGGDDVLPGFACRVSDLFP